MRIKSILPCVILPLLLSTLVPSTRAEYLSFLTTYQFGVNDGGFDPSIPLVQGANGTFYGGTPEGGANTYGVIYSLAPDGTFTVLHNFGSVDINGANDDGTALSKLILSSDGNLYGITRGGGSNHEGAFFAITPAGAFTTLHYFGATDADGTNLDGAQPTDLIQGGDGNFYGTAATGGTNGVGTVFQITPTGTLTTLYSFTVASAPGSGPVSLIQGRDGNFYGTTGQNMSTGDKGTIFSLTPAGVYTNLYTFGTNYSDGSGPQGLVQGNDGNFYGTTGNGGMNGSFPFGVGDGTAFKITPTGTFTPLLSFGGYGEIGSNPSRLILGNDGNFYGTTVRGGETYSHGIPSPGASRFGTLFQLTPAGAVSVVHSFTSGTNDGSGGNSLLLGSDGNFYGTSYDSGLNGTGTVYIVSPSGGHILAHSFAPTDGLTPSSDLVRGRDGSLYGTTGPTSTTNTIFSVNARNQLATLYRFPSDESQGFYLTAGLTQGADGNFYGTASYGGAHGGGTIFQFTPSGVFTVLHNFGSEANGPYSKLIQGVDGNFYGTSENGGSSDQGTVFSVSPSGVFNLLHNFSGYEGEFPHGLVQGRNGNFYGTTTYAGANDEGTIFAVTPLGVLTTLHSFSTSSANINNDGANPLAGLTLGTDGNFYGTTSVGGPQAGGTVFLVTPTGVLTSLHSFGTVNTTAGYAADGTYPAARLLQANDGNFYGTTSFGGYENDGTIFSITPAGVQNTLQTFSNAHGSTLLGSPVQGSNGGLYVALPSGGTNGYGLIGQYLLSPGAPTAAPVITSAPTASAQATVPFTYQIAASNAPTSYDAQGLPPGLSVDVASGLISGTPTASGTFAVTLSAINAGGTGLAALNLTVAAVPVIPPAITSALDANATVGTAFSYQITASEGPTGFNAMGLPPGLNIDTISGLIAGTPTAAGTYPVTLSASNANGSGSATLMFTVAPAPVLVPVITSMLSASVQVGSAFTYQVAATNTPMSFAATGLPAGITIDLASGLISGKASGTGGFAVTLSATNSAGKGIAVLNLTITASPVTPPVINSAATASATVNQPFVFPVSATNNPTSFTATGLPPSLTINTANGTISGPPASAGTYTITLGAANAGGTGTATLTLTVFDVPSVSFVLPSAGGSNKTTIVEGGPKLKVQLTRSGGDVSHALSVPYKVVGNSTAGADYKMLSGLAIIPAGATSAQIKVNAYDDAVADGTKIVKLKLLPSSDGTYTFGTTPKVKITIVDLQGIQ